MALTPIRSTGLIAVGELPGAVKNAVRIAEARFAPAAGKPPIINKWDWIGYRLKLSAVKDIAKAQEFATEVAAQVSAGGVKCDPVVGIVGGDITIGFIERINVPQIRTF